MLTNEDKVFIDKNRFNMYVSELSSKLKKSEAEIRVYLNKNRLEYKQRNMKYRTDLTPRENEVIALLAEGLTDKEIEARMGITYTTFKTHLANIYLKFGLDRKTLGIANMRVKAVLIYQRQKGWINAK